MSYLSQQRLWTQNNAEGILKMVKIFGLQLDDLPQIHGRSFLFGSGLLPPLQLSLSVFLLSFLTP